MEDETRPSNSEASRAPDSCWGVVGTYMTVAMLEIAENLGGKELADRVYELAQSESVLPDAAALKYLEDSHPGSAEQVIKRMHEIQSFLHQEAQANLSTNRKRHLGAFILDGFASFKFGWPVKRK